MCKQSMKRVGNLADRIFSIENLQLADKIASQGKMTSYGVVKHLANQEPNIIRLRESLINKTFRTSKYKTFFIYEPKEREIFQLPYYPDRITHHAVMNVLEPIFVSTFTADTYSCIKKRGIHGALRGVRKALDDPDETQFCLKLDIKKFYPNVNHDILKALLRKKLKDPDLLWLLDDVIDSAPGLPIGNYLSQYFANFYLTYFDHWIKEKKGVKHYFRYADDLVIFGKTKEELHQLLADIRKYLWDELRLTVKGNYQVFPVWARGVDFVGYKSYHEYTLLRKSIKKAFARMLRKRKNGKSIMAYKGWTMHGNCKNLENELLYGTNSTSNKV